MGDKEDTLTLAGGEPGGWGVEKVGEVRVEDRLGYEGDSADSEVPCLPGQGGQQS